MTRLILFDIDQTLLYTGGAGMVALRHAFREVFGLPPEEPIDLDLAGATDSGLLDEFRARRGLDHDPELEAGFFPTYLARLARELPQSSGGRVLPGVVPLLEALRELPVIAGLLTGNVRDGAVMKLRHFGLDAMLDLESGAYGDDHADRNLLGPLALGRANRRHGLRLAPEQVVVVGDTPRDIRCARALGARVLAVATGSFGVEDLAACWPDALVADLADTPAVLATLERLAGGG